jgi:hypothetical protein
LFIANDRHGDIDDAREQHPHKSADQVICQIELPGGSFSKDFFEYGE